MTRRDLDKQIDALFDREFDADERREAVRRIKSDPAACEEAAKTQRVISMLRSPVEAPDIADAVLERVDRRRGFLTPKLRRVVTFGRVAAALSLIAMVGAAAMARRWWPDATTLAQQPKPITTVVETGKAEAGESVRTLVDSAVELAMCLDTRDATPVAWDADSLFEAPSLSDMPGFARTSTVSFDAPPVLVRACYADGFGCRTPGFDLSPSVHRVVLVGREPVTTRSIIRVDLVSDPRPLLADDGR